VFTLAFFFFFPFFSPVVVSCGFDHARARGDGCPLFAFPAFLSDLLFFPRSLILVSSRIGLVGFSLSGPRQGFFAIPFFDGVF